MYIELSVLRKLVIAAGFSTNIYIYVCVLSGLLPVLVPEAYRPLWWCRTVPLNQTKYVYVTNVGACWPIAGDSNTTVYIVRLDSATANRNFACAT